MKKIQYLIVALVCVLSSCNDDINLEPENSVTFANYFQTDQELESALAQANQLILTNLSYNNIRPEIYGIKYDKAPSWLYDELDRTPNQFNEGAGNWSKYYGVITWANLLEEFTIKSDLSDDRKEFYLSQTNYIKAYVYFRLVREWRDAPFVEHSEDMGEKAKMPGVELIQKAIAFAEKSLSYAKPWSELKNHKGSPWTTRQIVGEGAIHALLAHMHAWNAQVFNKTESIDKAIAACTKVIGNSEFALASDPETVVSQVLVGEHPEVIYEVMENPEELGTHFGGILQVSRWFHAWPNIPNRTKGEYRNLNLGILSSTVEEMYEEGDLRRNAYFYQFEELKNDPELGGWAVVNLSRDPVMEIYQGSETFNSFRGDKVVCRLADIILLRAELYDLKGESSAAIADLNTIRSRANAKAYSSSEGPLRQIIFKERERELLLQGYRWYDCVRTGFWKTELSEAIGSYTDAEIQNGALYNPVHYTAFENNTLMEQNTYWLGKW